MGQRFGVGLYRLAGTSRKVFNTSSEFLNFLLGDSRNREMEEQAAQAIFDALNLNGGQNFISSWNAERHLVCILYCLIIEIKPLKVVETGVANGFSTNTILRALNEVGQKSELHSFDIDPKAQSASSGYDNWQFHLISPKRTFMDLETEVDKLTPIDMWLHDSDHCYWWQKRELKLAWKKLSENGILICDDVDYSSAWLSLSKSLFDTTYLVVDTRKVVGIAIKGSGKVM